EPDYTMLFTMHASIMIFFVIIPFLVGAFANFSVPLMIGARDMAFPALNMISYWLMWPAYLCMLASFFVDGGAGAAGWTAYPPLATGRDHATGGLLTSEPQLGQTLWLWGVFFVGFSSLTGAVNYITTIIKMRAPGMTLLRLPLTVWAVFITSCLVLFATPVLTSAVVMQILDRMGYANFFDPYAGGQPLLWQHLFWFYSHPAVYIMILPAMGVVSDILATFCRKPVFGYKPMVASISGIAGLGFIVWGHHMFMSGMNPALGMTFMVTTMMIALPSAVKVFNWLATIYGGNIRFSPPFCYAVGFVSMFIIGGLSGIFMAAAPVDIQMHDTYFIVAHIHYVLFASSAIGIFGGLTYWFPKMVGRMMNDPLSYVHFALTFVFLNGVFFPMHVLGTGAFPRRIGNPYVYEFLKAFQPMNQVMTTSAMLLGAAQILFLVNFFWSMFAGQPAPRNPWRANTLEWSTASPPPAHLNFETIPTVYRGPYEYSSPESEDDYFPQWQPSGAPQPAPLLAGRHAAPALGD
ncbi:MAG: cbb3-type cytochrome c oxidase subunit I, partial [Planctomycetes bacterium]|nr:cbb3-type cytochrome c oxidase subunit I [Planctomycetota bacterium]